MQYSVFHIYCMSSFLCTHLWSLHFFLIALQILSRCIRISLWETNINPQSSARHYIPNVRKKWTSFKFSGFLPWQNLMQVSFIATKVLSKSVLDLQKQSTSVAWRRLGIILIFYFFIPSVWFFCQFFLVVDHQSKTHFLLGF